MDSHLITYDLNKQGQDYKTLHEKIKSIGTWWHCLESVWIVKSNNSASEIRDFLKTYIDSNDELLVIRVTKGWATQGLSDKCNKWLKDNLT